ncbi:MAG TPA: hypothetical protein OIM11_00035 [Coriobacteriaceae bacterium]|nr:hypothetical protein [Coriobacteriaceae bacterium]
MSATRDMTNGTGFVARVTCAAAAVAFAVIIGCAAFAGLPSTAWAVTDGWTVTFTGSSMTSDGTADINKTLSGMQPGDSATFDVKLLNDCSEEASWYMKNSVLESMETELAKGGSYTYRLSYTGPGGKTETIIGNETVSGEGADSEGLFDATTATGEWFFLDNLPAHGQGQVTLYVALDPESHGNSYFDTEAKLRLEFAAEVPGGKMVTQDKSSTPANKATGGSRLPSTGDMVKFGLPVAAVIIALVAWVAIRRRSSTRKEGGK